jgi:putative tryptophan/tyrosine transport system substrate-binding protein
MMRRSIGLLVTLALAILWVPCAATAQPPATISRIGVLAPGQPEGDRAIPAFRQGLRDLGYVEGQSIRLESRYADWQLDRLPALAAELVRLNPDVIYASATPGGLAAQQASTTIPIVVVGTALVERGVVASLERPGGNMTGITLRAELYGKQLELLKETAPHIVRVAMLVNPANQGPAVPLPSAEARALGVQLHLIEVRAPGEFDGAFAAIAEARADALLVPSDALFGGHRHRIAELAATHRLPSIARSAGFAEAGGLIQYGEDSRELHRRAATYVDKILKGAKPADLPVEQHMKFEFVINLKTAQALGLTIPPSLLFQADEIIR